jgi:hypothetical protein
MLAHVRFCFLLSLFAFFVAAHLPANAQINGVPASVTSYGFGGHTNPNPGVRASVTSLGPNGYAGSRPIIGNCCGNFFLPTNPNLPLFSARRHRRGDHDRDHGSFPIASEPVYVPYAVPYGVQYAADDDDDDGQPDADSPDADYDRPRNHRSADMPVKRATGRHSTQKADVSAEPTLVEPDEPVAAQPSTVLVFKDGHQSDVVNYAIVGDTLFDFGSGRTRKILLADLDLTATRKTNDDHGVDFQIPASAKIQ